MRRFFLFESPLIIKGALGREEAFLFQQSLAQVLRRKRFFLFESPLIPNRAPGKKEVFLFPLPREGS